MDRPRYTCTAEAPWTSDKGAAEHPDATYLYDRDRDYVSFAVYHCDHCDLRFEEELPQ